VLESVAAGRIVTLGHPQTSIMAGLNCATPSLIAWPLVSRGIDLFLAVPDGFVAEATRVLAADGIVAGECGAAGLAALTAVPVETDLGPASRVLLLCTEGATDPEAYRRLVG
jgi:diaminopropionate ammonia-lyase